jgi:tRNA A-37 threonylcarbamoyl transferase component Bud32
MAELAVRGICKSTLRTALTIALDFAFPIWGIVLPIASVVLFVVSLVCMCTGSPTQYFAHFATCLCISITCLLSKRILSDNSITVNQRGILLPLFLGSRIVVRRFIPWSRLECITASIPNGDLKQAKLDMKRQRGGQCQLPLHLLDLEFVEQLVLAVQHWAPALYDTSLADLQNSLRIGTDKNGELGYTQLWEEELARRFISTNYVPLEPGRVLRNNSLRIVNELASGGLSALYLCQLDDRKLVVLKEAVVPAMAAEGVKDKAKELFEREAKLLISLDHPGIVRVLDCFTENERNYLLLEYVNGADLRQLVKQHGPQKEEDVLEWALQIAGALKYLHEKEHPIIHRDLTPDNIVLRNDGKIVIVDFGAANEFIGTATGTFVGKQAYIAAEQIRGKATTQSDIYSFGCTLFFLLTGAEPEALSPSNPRTINPKISAELSELIETCTQSEAANRYPSVAQMIPVLRRLSSLSLGA